MLILWGMKDFVFDHHLLQEWTNHFPAAEVQRFDEAGHFVFEDEPAAIDRRIAQFFERHSVVREHLR
jgi:haloalkane dehalogenase